jgi:NADH:ubiquinone oxidoreductase subunit K
LKYLPIIRVLLGLLVAVIGIYNIFANKNELFSLLMVLLGILMAVISIEKRNKDQKKK